MLCLPEFLGGDEKCFNYELLQLEKRKSNTTKITDEQGIISSAENFFNSRTVEITFWSELR